MKNNYYICPMEKQTNQSIVAACLFAFIFIFAILIVQSCGNGTYKPSESVDSSHVHIDSLQTDSAR